MHSRLTPHLERLSECQCALQLCIRRRIDPDTYLRGFPTISTLHVHILCMYIRNVYIHMHINHPSCNIKIYVTFGVYVRARRYSYALVYVHEGVAAVPIALWYDDIIGPVLLPVRKTFKSELGCARPLLDPFSSIRTTWWFLTERTMLRCRRRMWSETNAFVKAEYIRQDGIRCIR